jgi:hypothetical protein
VVARRKLQASQTEAFEVMKKQEFLKSESRIKVTGLSDIDGEYVILAMGEKDRGGGKYGSGDGNRCANKSVEGTNAISNYTSCENTTQGNTPSCLSYELLIAAG